MEREEVVRSTDAAAQLTLWLSGDIDLEPVEALELIGDLLELALDALTKSVGRTPKR